jgi:hypothetical protein
MRRVLSKLRDTSAKRLALPETGRVLTGLVTLGFGGCFLFCVNVIGYGGAFEASRGFPVPYEVWTDYELFPREYPWAIPVDIVCAACFVALIVFLTCRRSARPDDAAKAGR